MRRLVAVLAAVALVVGAVVLRSRLDRGGDDGAGDGDGTAVAAVVACSDEVMGACRTATGNVALGLTAGEALDRLGADPLAEADAAVDAWVLPRYVVDAVQAQRARTGLPPVFGEVSESVAHTTVVPVGVPERLAALEAACGRPVDWACLAEQAGRPWADLGEAFPDRVRLGLDPPASSAVGLLALGALGAATFGTVDPNQVDTQAWFQDLRRNRLPSPPLGQSALAVLATRAGTYDAAAALAVEAERVAASNPRVAVLAPSPPVVLDVVVAAGAGRALDEDLVRELRSELTRTGWEGGDLPTSLAPAGDVLAALRNISGR